MLRTNRSTNKKKVLDSLCLNYVVVQAWSALFVNLSCSQQLTTGLRINILAAPFLL